MNYPGRRSATGPGTVTLTSRRFVAAGWTISAIARRLHLDRKTVRRFRDTDLDYSTNGASLVRRGSP